MSSFVVLLQFLYFFLGHEIIIKDDIHCSRVNDSVYVSTVVDIFYKNSDEGQKFIHQYPVNINGKVYITKLNVNEKAHIFSKGQKLLIIILLFTIFLLLLPWLVCFLRFYFSTREFEKKAEAILDKMIANIDGFISGRFGES